VTLRDHLVFLHFGMANDAVAAARGDTVILAENGSNGRKVTA
jgi:hypothetical protein